MKILAADRTSHSVIHSSGPSIQADLNECNVFNCTHCADRVGVHGQPGALVFCVGDGGGCLAPTTKCIGTEFENAANIIRHGTREPRVDLLTYAAWY